MSMPSEALPSICKLNRLPCLADLLRFINTMVANLASSRDCQIFLQILGNIVKSMTMAHKYVLVLPIATTEFHQAVLESVHKNESMVS